MASCATIKKAPTQPMQSSAALTPALEMTRKFSLSKLRRGLPFPSFTPQLPAHAKKSHAKRQPKDHVPRPRNAFMLFRSDFVRQKKVPEDVENDQGNISRIAGKIWRHMGDAEKKPWVDMAKSEKERHAKLHPNYRYAPIGPRRKPEKKLKVEQSSELWDKERGREGRDVERVRPRQREHEHERPKMEANWGDLSSFLLPVRRSSSCPPGATRTPNTLLEAQHAVHDDITSSRRPSRVTYYQSTPIGSEQIDPPNPHMRCSNQWNTMTVGPFAPQPEVYNRWDVPAQVPIEWTSWAQPPAYDAAQDMSTFNYSATNTDIWSVPNPFHLPPLDHPAPFPDAIAPTDISPLMAMPPQPSHPPSLAPNMNPTTVPESVDPLAPAYHAPPSLSTSYLPQGGAPYGASAGTDAGFTNAAAGAPSALSFSGSGVDFSSELEFGTDYDFSAYTTDNALDFFNNNAKPIIDFTTPFDEKFSESLFPVDFGFGVGGPERDIEVMLPGLTLGTGDVQR